MAVHGYAGDAHQMHALMPVYEHHGIPIVILTPDDSPVHVMGPHICRTAGKRAYVGQDSWDRQHLQLKVLLEYPAEWYLLNDSDSFLITPEFPDYLFEDDNVVYSNQVTDFRVPGETYIDASGSITWAADYHAGFPLIAMQPPYFLSRRALERIVQFSEGLVACPVTPFIDWWWIPACYAAGVKHLPFRTGASCETVTPNGLQVMTNCVNDGATFLHSIKTHEVMESLRAAHRLLCARS